MTPSTAEQLPQHHLALKAVMMPRDTNPHGTIFGGVLLSYIDQAGAEASRHTMRVNRWPASPVVTVAMNQVEFHEPVFVGDVLSFWTDVVRIGNTSISVRVTVETEREGHPIKLTQADVIYVAINLDAPTRTPVPVRVGAA